MPNAGTPLECASLCILSRRACALIITKLRGRAKQCFSLPIVLWMPACILPSKRIVLAAYRSMPASKHAKLNEDPTKFVGRISLSAESLRVLFIFGRYGYLPYRANFGVLKPCFSFVIRMAQAWLAHSKTALDFQAHVI